MKKASNQNKLRVTKLSGAGNTFLIIDWRDNSVRAGYRKKFGASSRGCVASILCDPYKSVGADGLLFLETPKKDAGAGLQWDFYNADGSRAEMCGNAARTVGLFESERGGESLAYPLGLLTRAGVVTIAQNKPGVFRVEMPEVRAFLPNQEAKMGREKFTFDFVNTGVPHAVIHVSRGKNLDFLTKNVDKLVETVDCVRSLTQFKKTGTNVTFYVTKDARPPRLTHSAKIESLTFERGVSGYTQACGTGVVAAAYSLSHKREKSTPKVSIRVPGGQLEVLLDSRRPVLVGPAIKIAEIYLS